MKNILQKTTLAVAIAACSTGVFAGTHTVDGEGAVVLANEIFGAGSEDTLVAVPVSTFAIDIAKDDILAAEVATVKYTLDKGAVFGEDLSDIDKWAASNATLSFDFDNTGTIVVVGGAGAPYAQDPNFEIVVDQGGAIGDNTVTFKITNVSGAAAVLTLAQAGQFRVKALTSALERGVANPRVRLGTEFRNVDTSATDTQAAVTVLQSQDGVELTGTLTDYTAGGGRARISVADTELSFTGVTGNGAAQDFDSATTVGYVDLGDLQVVRTEYDGQVTNGLVVKKENGDDFDFQGSDEPVITLTSTSNLDSYASIYLRPFASGACTGATAGGDFSVTPAAGATSVDINLSGETTAELEAGYQVCLVANGTVAIPESSFSAELNVSYFNPRYTDSQDTLSYEAILRNGCQVTLFNVPNANSGDKAYIRLTNVSELPGAVRGFIWDQDGNKLDLGSELVANLPAHGTAVLSSEAASLPALMPEYGALTSGRHRIVLQGAFPACEALGLVRTPAGVLTNMTSTTYSGDPSRLGTDNNGTSNTTN